MLKYDDIDTPYKVRGVRIHVCWVLLFCSDDSAECLSALGSARRVDGSAGGGWKLLDKLFLAQYKTCSVCTAPGGSAKDYIPGFIFLIIKESAAFNMCPTTSTPHTGSPSHLHGGTWRFSMFAGIPFLSTHIIPQVFPPIPPNSHFFAKECWLSFPSIRCFLKNHSHLSPYPCDIDGLLFKKPETN